MSIKNTFENNLLFGTVLLVMGAIIYLICSEEHVHVKDYFKNNIIEISCKRLDGSIVIYKTKEKHITNRAMFSFITTDGRKVITPYCFYEGVK